MTAPVAISLVGVICSIAVAIIGVVWRLGTRVGEVGVRLMALEHAAREAASECERRHSSIEARVSALEHGAATWEQQWEATHKAIEMVARLDRRVAGIEAVCKDRIRCEESGRWEIGKDGRPRRV